MSTTYSSNLVAKIYMIHPSIGDIHRLLFQLSFMLLYDDVTSSCFQSYASMIPSPNMMYPIMLIMIPTMIVILYNIKLET